MRVPDTFVSDSSWLPDGSALILGTSTLERTAGRYGGALLVVDAESWTLERTIPLPAGEAQVLEWSPDDSVLAVGAVDDTAVFLYDDQLRELRTIDLGDGGDTYDLSFSPDGRLLAAGRADGTISVIDTRKWRPVHEPARVHAEAVLDVEWLPDSNTVVTAGKDELVSLYDVERDLVRSRALPASGPPRRRVHLPGAVAGPTRSSCSTRARPVTVTRWTPGLAGPGLHGGRAGPDPGRVGQVPPRHALPAGVPGNRDQQSVPR